ncbi:hypothetical protein FNV43_RR17188 [Rhamnella rubrinervis]|uniref:Uncharacterized protein n=1 Tax=Rhamnella rubrinervis TaxID=2594499 RepID=A0A8K0GVJ2_9ROSA|nr:hypothetical protein FNV43_RR17188 [Rhamnella rubrinervis]
MEPPPAQAIDAFTKSLQVEEDEKERLPDKQDKKQRDPSPQTWKQQTPPRQNIVRIVVTARMAVVNAR